MDAAYYLVYMEAIYYIIHMDASHYIVTELPSSSMRLLSQAADRSRHGLPISEPEESIGRFDRQSSVVSADPRRPNAADSLEVE